MKHLSEQSGILIEEEEKEEEREEKEEGEEEEEEEEVEQKARESKRILLNPAVKFERMLLSIVRCFPTLVQPFVLDFRLWPDSKIPTQQPC